MGSRAYSKGIFFGGVVCVYCQLGRVVSSSVIKAGLGTHLSEVSPDGLMQQLLEGGTLRPQFQRPRPAEFLQREDIVAERQELGASVCDHRCFMTIVEQLALVQDCADRGSDLVRHPGHETHSRFDCLTYLRDVRVGAQHSPGRPVRKPLHHRPTAFHFHLLWCGAAIS